MNRSFQSIAALLISLSGAMLAVVWTPAEGPRPPAASSSARRRTATLPCGFVATNLPIATRIELADDRSARSEKAEAETSDLAPPQAGPIKLTLDARWLEERGADLAMIGRAISDAPAARAVSAAFSQALRPLSLTSRGELPLADQSLRDVERRRIEAEYAAAEWAAAGSHREPWLAAAWGEATTQLRQATAAAVRTDWPSIYKQLRNEFYNKFDEVIVELGWEEMVRPLVAHVRRQHERLALREALLREMDRRFLEIPVHQPDGPPPDRPKVKRPNRRLLVAAADALKSLSKALDAAAEQLDAVSRQDVAELYNPVENSEEKR
jgi:hypothetical protein